MPQDEVAFGSLNWRGGLHRQSRTVGRGMPVFRLIAQSFIPAATSRRTSSNSSADRIVAPFALLPPT